MNRSRLVDSAVCMTICQGRCCQSLIVEFDKKSGIIESGLIKRFEFLATDKIRTIHGERTISLEFDYPCVNFKDGKCAVYNSPERPPLCATYPEPETENCPYMRR